MDSSNPQAEMYHDRETRVAHSMSMDECIERCLECAEACEALVPHCLAMGGEHASVAHIRLLMDCADICTLSSRFMIRGSDLHMETCATCAAICDACAKDCERLAGDDQVMRDCALACRRCEESCRAMAVNH